MLPRPLVFILTIVIGLFSSTLFAGSSSLKPAIGGYSPVSYFTVNKAEKGSPEFSAQHNGKLYYLTSQEQVKIFNQNPDKFKPRHEVCTYSLTLGKVSPLDPTNFKVVGDTLLLFHKSDHADGLALWNSSSSSEQDLLSRADKKYKLFNF